MPEPEHWHRIYRERPEVFAAFARAEDPDGRIVACLERHARLEGTTTLEVGCGTGRTSAQLAARCGRYLATDPSPALLALARRGGVAPWLLRARAEALPLVAGSVDRVLATWVLAYLRPESRAGALREASRVLRPGPAAGVWVVENHWEGEFQELRGREGYGAEPGVRALLEEEGFHAVERVETEIRFGTAAEAGTVLGALCGEAVAAALRRNPRRSFGHGVVLLHRPA
jgi:ubiquinone/menaquinone biosynthesis C-methylase UbiE